MDINGYIQNAGLVHRPVKELEKGVIDGPKAIVMHRTVSTTASSTLNSFKQGIGTHFLIDKDGTSYQTASLQQMTWHVGPIQIRTLVEETSSPEEVRRLKALGVRGGHAHERKKAYPDRFPMNEDSVGIEVVAMYWPESKHWDAPTPDQRQSIFRLISTLQSLYSLTDADVYAHDRISYKTHGEGAGLHDGGGLVPARLPPPFF